MSQVPELAEYLDDMANQLERRLRAQPGYEEEEEANLKEKKKKSDVDSGKPRSALRSSALYFFGALGALLAGAFLITSYGSRL